MKRLKRAIRGCAALTITAVVVAWAMLGCGASARQKTLNGAFQTARAAASAWEAWDRQHIADIVAAATSKADGEAKLDAYATKRAEVEKAFEATFVAIAAAAVADDDRSLASAIAVAAALQKTLSDLGVRP